MPMSNNGHWNNDFTRNFALIASSYIRLFFSDKRLSRIQDMGFVAPELVDLHYLDIFLVVAIVGPGSQEL